DAPAVKDLRRLEARIKATDTMLVIVQAPTPEVRAKATAELVAGLRGLPPSLVEEIADDDAEVRAFMRANKWMFVPLTDLEQARDALSPRTAAGKLAATRVYVDVEDRSRDDAGAKQRLDDLRAKREKGERGLDRSSHISADGKTALVEVRIAFSTSD